MDFELTEEQRAFAQTARDFALAELAPHARVGRRRHLPKEAIAKAGELGFAACMPRSRRRPRPAPAGRHAGV